MTLYIENLLWTEDNIEHIAEHRVKPSEVEDAIWDSPLFEKRRGHQRYHVYGQTAGARYLFIILDRERGADFYVVTARDITDREKSYYRQRQR